MNRSSWDEEDIIKLVKKLPKVKDNRSPEEIYSKIKDQVHPNNKGKQYKVSKWVPAGAAIAALFILILLSPSLVQYLNTDSKSSNSTDRSSASLNKSDRVETANLKEKSRSFASSEETNDNTINSQDQKMAALSAMPTKLSVYEEDLLTHDVITLGLVTKDAVTVPVSVLVQKDNTKNLLEKYQHISENIPEEQWGFDNMYPLKGTFTWGDTEKELNLTLNDNISYSGSSAIEDAFFNMIKYSFHNQGIETVHLRTKDGGTPEFSQMGPLAEININVDEPKSYYLYSPVESERYLVPDQKTIKYTTLSEAVSEMKKSPNDFFTSIIPKGVDIEVKESDNEVTFHFAEPLKLDEMDLQQSSELIEGLMLTAKSFGFTEVNFTNTNLLNWNGYDFSKPLKVPIAPNKKILQ